MKHLTKIKSVTALQIVAILILFLFGNPGCNANQELKYKPVVKQSFLVNE